MFIHQQQLGPGHKPAYACCANGGKPRTDGSSKSGIMQNGASSSKTSEIEDEPFLRCMLHGLP